MYSSIHFFDLSSLNAVFAFFDSRSSASYPFLAVNKQLTRVFLFTIATTKLTYDLAIRLDLTITKTETIIAFFCNGRRVRRVFSRRTHFFSHRVRTALVILIIIAELSSCIEAAVLITIAMSASSPYRFTRNKRKRKKTQVLRSLSIFSFS